VCGEWAFTFLSVLPNFASFTVSMNLTIALILKVEEALITTKMKKHLV
jgi:hypothetical protein